MIITRDVNFDTQSADISEEEIRESGIPGPESAAFVKSKCLYSQSYSHLVEEKAGANSHYSSNLGLNFFDGFESPIHLSIIFAYSWSSSH